MWVSTSVQNLPTLQFRKGKTQTQVCSGSMRPTMVSDARLWVDSYAGILSAGVSWLSLSWGEQLLGVKKQHEKNQNKWMHLWSHHHEGVSIHSFRAIGWEFVAFGQSVAFFGRSLGVPPFEAIQILPQLWTCFGAWSFPFWFWVCFSFVNSGLGWHLIGHFDLSTKVGQCCLCHKYVVTRKTWANTPDRKLAQPEV